MAQVGLLATPPSTAVGNNSLGLGLTSFQMLRAVRCPRIQHLQCQEGWQLAGIPESGEEKKMAWELSVSSISQRRHLISCVTLRKTPGLSLPSLSQGNHPSYRVDMRVMYGHCQASGIQQSSGDRGHPSSRWP